MQLDAKSILLANMVVMLANGCILGVIRSDLPDAIRPSATTWWVGIMMLALGVVGLALGSTAPTHWALPLANGLLMLGPLCYWFALRQFYGLPNRYSLFFPAALGVFGIYWFLVISPSITARIGVITLVWVYATVGAITVLLGQAQRDTSRSRKVLLGVFFLTILEGSARAVYYMTAELPVGWTLVDNSITMNSIMPLVSTASHIITTTAYLLLCSDRIRRQWEHAASTDYLTGLSNRLTLMRAGVHRLKEARRMGVPFALAVLDVDHFKAVNDRYGHDVGDVALQHVAALLRAECRANELAARQGGEEFVVLLENQDAVGAMAAAERLRATIARTAFQAGAVNASMTVSIGVAVLAPSDSRFDALLRRADIALYQAKAQGRNQVVLAD